MGVTMDMYNLISFVGIFVLMAIAWSASKHRRRLNVRAICWGVGIQLALAALIFHAPGSRGMLLQINSGVLELLGTAQAGQKFLFGNLADGSTMLGGGKALGFVFAFQAVPVIIFFSALMALLYHWRIMPLIIRGFARVFTRLMRISGAESVCAASNIFVGIESATAVRPYLGKMTESEFCMILTAGMATVASSTLMVYVGFLKDVFPTIAGHLISASLLSAPAAIVMSKLLLPETGRPLTLGTHIDIGHDPASGAIDAIINGAMAGVRLIVGICALLIAFLGLVALVDLILAGACGTINWGLWKTGLDCAMPILSLGVLLSYVFYPLSILIGVPPADALAASKMLGQRLIVTEIPAYMGLADAMESGALAHPRSAVVIAYALCGFAHVASMAIFVGGIAALVPERRKDLAAVGPRALLAATLACLMTGAVAGAFFHGEAAVLNVAGP